ncbi:carbamoyl-phosphate synthase L chain, ATP binding domain-containing protein [Pilobolus umbonatus]|nr:carbamoyl-phosphate synthase L chain, ATP binding domain-containing protein [Pilobolus umbonatus]
MTKILVANRGEIAIRIIAAATDLGYQTVAIYSDENDRNHCDKASQSIKIGSFVNIEYIIEAAIRVHATAIHPGYGFLSESAELANQCQKNSILFIGPSVQSMMAVSDKISAQQVAKDAGVPTIPGTGTSISSSGEVYAFAKQYGYPIMLKARDGGGGRGIRMVHSAEEVPDCLTRCLNESSSRQVFAEKAILNVKHIEVQILGDTHGNIIHLLERDCSAQRRYQKILEVAPCPCLPSKLQSSVLEAAIRLGSYIKYDSAGTVEFLVDIDSKEFYFMEVNPRIQVEHTITEQITHTDIVQAQIRIAFGASLIDMGLTQERVYLNHLVSIQARIVAENPMNNHMLSVGKIKNVQFPYGQGIRIDTWIKQSTVILPIFDSLLAKVIVTGQSYEDALVKMKRALSETVIEGVDTNIDFLIALVSNNSLTGDRLSHMHIQTIENRMNDLLSQTSMIATKRKAIMSTSALPYQSPPSVSNGIQFKPGDGFNIQIHHPSPITHSFQIESISKNTFPDELIATVRTSLPDMPQPVPMTITRKSQAGASSQLRRKANSQNMNTDIASPLTGMVVEINVQEGDSVKVGQQLFVISAMKMETVVQSSILGRVKKIYASAHELIEGGDMIIELTELNNSKL